MDNFQVQETNKHRILFYNLEFSKIQITPFLPFIRMGEVLLYYPVICPKGLQKATKSWIAGIQADLNLGPPKYEAGVLST